MPHIQQIKITKFWGKYDIDWTLDPQVNILFGFNGSGKTTLINEVYSTFAHVIIFPRTHTKNVEAKVGSINIIFDDQEDFFVDYSNLVNNKFSNTYLKDRMFGKIATFDTTKYDGDKKTSPLFQELQTLVYGNGSPFTNHFEKYRSKRLDLLDEEDVEESNKIEQNIQLFYEIVNAFFAVSKKKIKFKEQKMFFENSDKKIELEQLSSGEKQLLIILLNVLLQDKKDYTLFMDEPEISLHITWQQMLIEKILLLNPNCQLIIATHSPSVFGKGWRDKVVRMEELLKEEA